MIIDYRSDTVTKPTKGMLDAMTKANVGDDVFGEDPSVNDLEKSIAKLFHREAALFCPSGTMTNQIAIKCHTHPGDEVICDESAHVYQYEGGGIAFNSGASVKLLVGDRGRIKAEQVANAINAEDDHKARTSLVCLENTSNRGGGSCYDLEEIKKIKKVCLKNNLAFHLDGARLWNAMVAKKETAKQYGEAFDSISVCMSKSLGCPAGSLLIGDEDFIKKARRIRKVFGGGMRQAGYYAAACSYAMKNHVARLAEDHAHARMIGAAFVKKEFVDYMLPVETNIIIFVTKVKFTSEQIVQKLKRKNILAYAITKEKVRLVTHLDIRPEMVQRTIDVIKHL